MTHLDVFHKELTELRKKKKLGFSLHTTREPDRMLGCFHTWFSCLVRTRAPLLPPPHADLCSYFFFFLVLNHSTFEKNEWMLARFIFVLQNLNKEWHMRLFDRTVMRKGLKERRSQFLLQEIRYKFYLLQRISAYQESK